MSNSFEKYAHDLALAAITGKRESLVSVVQPFMKSAAFDLAASLRDPTVQRYLLGGLGGAGAGALIGAMQPDGKKRKSLSYGLLGGLGGLSLAHLLAPSLNSGTSGNSKPAPRTTSEPTTIETAAQMPKTLLTPLRDLPATPAETGNSYVDAAINLPAQAVQTAINADPALGAASPAAAAALAGTGMWAGNRAARGIQTRLNDAIARGNTARLARFDANNPAPKTPMRLADVAARDELMAQFGNRRRVATEMGHLAAQDARNKRVYDGAVQHRQLNRQLVESGNTIRGRVGGVAGLLTRIALPAMLAYSGARTPGAIEESGK